ncbi:adenylyl cyclase-associated protein [Bombardia bombarda]|uniref:Adenylyl cyclase-associated protein n=1 Tax=Bombardia bombarda TaxID=252184 RepID=A0AA39XNK5_9PEZI|nr:adenylyl cyclase-associated protein [Bombardia bombarda]
MSYGANLMRRLEAATLRLEDIATSTIELPQAVPALQQTLASPRSLASTLSTPAPASIGPPAPKMPPQEPVPESIEEFDAFIEQTVVKYVKNSKAIGGPIAEQAAAVLKGFQAMRRFLLITTKSKKLEMSGNDMKVYQELLKPISNAMLDISSIKESNRGSQSDQITAVNDGMFILSWVTVDARPYKHVEEGLSSAQYYGNKVLKAYKDKDPQQVEWLQSFYQIFRDLAEYIKTYFAHGIPWNPKGLPAQEVAKSLSSPPAFAAGGPPPPPPPPPGPPPILQINEQKAEPTAAGGLGAVFSELNKGEAVTKGLRKVDKSEMTHKNPSLRAGSVVAEREGGGSARGKSPAPARKPKPESMRAKKPPKMELDGNKWTIENFDKDTTEPIEVDASISHSILISRCSNCTIVIKGKANAITIDNTSRLSLVIDSLVSSVDAVKCQNLALQVLGTIPSVLMDQIDGAQLYFSKESTATRVYSSKSANINLNIFSTKEDDYKEVPLPSQLCSYFDEDKGDLVNEIVSHSG